MQLTIRIASFLMFPLALLLCVQWPLREWIHAYASQANDLGQVVFACYVAMALLAASRHHTHLAAGAVAHSDDSDQSRTWRTWVSGLCLGPWAMFMLWASFDTIKQSVATMEHFPETLSPGYFLIKLALGLLLVFVLLDLAEFAWQAIKKAVL